MPTSIVEPEPEIETAPLADGDMADGEVSQANGK